MNFRLLLFFLAHYGFLGLLTLFAYLIGARLSRRVSYRSPAERFSFCTGLGLGVLAHLVMALGLLHLLTRAALLALLGIVALYLAPRLKQLQADIAQWRRSTTLHRRLLFALPPVLLLPLFLLPLYPPTQWDAISYH